MLAVISLPLPIHCNEWVRACIRECLHAGVHTWVLACVRACLHTWVLACLHARVSSNTSCLRYPTWHFACRSGHILQHSERLGRYVASSVAYRCLVVSGYFINVVRSWIDNSSVRIPTKHYLNVTCQLWYNAYHYQWESIQNIIDEHC